jgi:hypothetical protein
MQWQGEYDTVNDRPTTISLGPSVKVVDCRYRCGSKFVVTTRLERAPAHIECAIRRAVEHNTNMHLKRGEDWNKYLVRLSQWVNMELKQIGTIS